jgi:hypothetical protein
MPKLYNLARMTTATLGTGTITLGAAVPGYLTFAGAGAANGDVVTYGINDGTNSEIGTGTYTASGTTLTRTVIASTNGNAAISLDGAAEVFITPSNQDFFAPGTACLFQQSTAPVGWTKVTTFNDALIRVVSGTASSGGSNAFSAVNAQSVVGSTTLAASQIPSHTHNFTAGFNLGNGASGFSSAAITGNTASGGLSSNQAIPTQTTDVGTGGNGAHNHSIAFNILFVDTIIATKN